MIHFYSSHTSFGGSTLILSSVVRLLNEAGVPVLFHGTDPWFESLSPYNKADGFPKLKPDDIFVCHLLALLERPNVKKSIYVTHEETWAFRVANFKCQKCGTAGVHKHRAGSSLPAVCRPCAKRTAEFTGLVTFDHVVFSSIAHEKKSRSLQTNWGPSSIIPNPVEVDFVWQPPTEPVAGIIGTVEPRKAPHISIQKAQDAGFKKILLYGNKAPAYFDEYVAPLLNEDVRYMGLADDREAMYNSISEVFHYSTQEQALMVLGECKKLGIPFHGSDDVHDWDLYSDEHIVTAWRNLLEV